jgi:methyl-accepting chemotaxis protein
MTLTLKAKLIVMASVAIFSVCVLTLMGYLLGKKAGIGSDSYQKIQLTSVFVADIAPPFLFMVEAANKSEQLSSVLPEKRAPLIKEIEAHFEAFNETSAKWSTSTDIPADIVADVKKKLIPQGQQYQAAMRTKILEPAQAGDMDRVMAGYLEVEELFAEHNKIASDLTARASELNTQAQEEGAGTVSSYTILLLSVAGVSIILVVFISLYFIRSILQGLGVDPEELKRITSAVAGGDLDIKLPAIRDEASVLGAAARMIEALKLNLVKAKENQRIRTSLDSASTNVMIADVKGTVIYTNSAMQNFLTAIEPAARTLFPSFSASKVQGSDMDIFQKGINSTTTLSAKNTTIEVANKTFNLMTSPIYDASGERLGTVLEWVDRTQEISAENDINNLVEKASLGDFTARVSIDGKTGFFLKAAEGLNALVETTDRGLTDVSRVLGAIAKGDLTERMDGDYAGTFSELKNYCNNTTDSLSKMLSDIRNAAETTFTASSEIAAGNADLSGRTEQQAANLEETASSMEELTSTVRLNADNAKQANVLAEQASTVAVDGGSLIQQVVNTMNAINESARKISDIIGVIDGVAFQTNILALNAAVEAARAGDQGRGFAVVASEVRTLAQRSANAAKDIKVLISDSVQKIDNGNQLVGKSGETMKEIVTAIKRVNDIMAEIAAASVEQSAGIEEVSTAVSQMDEMTQQNAALVEEAAAAAESLQSQADQLTRNVSAFKLAIGEKEPMLLKAQPALAKSSSFRTSSAPKKMELPKSAQEDEWESF